MSKLNDDRLPDTLIKALTSLQHSLRRLEEILIRQVHSGPQEAPPPTIVLPPELKLPQEVGEFFASERSDRKKNRIWSKINGGLTVLSVMVASSAAVISYWALNQTQRHFQMDQRPYIAVGEVQLVDANGKEAEPVVGQPLFVNILMKNVGKGLALTSMSIGTSFSGAAFWRSNRN